MEKGLNKIVPTGIKNKLKRNKSWLKNAADQTKQNNPFCFCFIRTVIAVINLGLYFFDMITDFNLLFIFADNYLLILIMI